MSIISRACRVRGHDMMIVNTTWMSFRLQAAPPTTFSATAAQAVGLPADCGARRAHRPLKVAVYARQRQ